jgi:hypothetical protein
VNIIIELKNIDDLLKIIEKYTMDENTTYNINLKAFYHLFLFANYSNPIFNPNHF